MNRRSRQRTSRGTRRFRSSIISSSGGGIASRSRSSSFNRLKSQMLPGLASIPFRILSFLAVMFRHDMGSNAFQRLLASPLRRRLRIRMDPEERRRPTPRCIITLTRLLFAQLRDAVRIRVLVLLTTPSVEWAVSLHLDRRRGILSWRGIRKRTRWVHRCCPCCCCRCCCHCSRCWWWCRGPRGGFGQHR